MEITIKAEPKEIADFVLQLQSQPTKKFVPESSFDKNVMNKAN